MKENGEAFNLYTKLADTSPYVNDVCAGVKSRNHQLLFDGVLHWLFSSVSHKLVDSRKSIYQVDIIVPGRTYTFYLTPVPAMFLGRTIIFNKMTRDVIGYKPLAVGIELTPNNVVYIPRWAERSIVKVLDKIVNENKNQLKNDMARIEFLYQSEVEADKDEADVPKNKRELH